MKKAKAIRWWVPQIGAKEGGYIRRVLDNDFPNEGELTTLFEDRVARLLCARHAVAVTSGTAAMFLALKALGIGHGDEVIVPDMTFIATANAVEMCGAKPVLADIDPVTMNISAAAVERAVTNRTRAVMPVHVSGRAADMAAISGLARRRGIEIIEDAAEAFMSKHKGRHLGTYGRFGCFSFSPHKTITTGQGGMVVTNDERMYVRLRELKDQGRPVRGTGGDDRHDVIGYNFKFTDLQAAVGLGQLEYLSARVRRMKAICKLYHRNLKDVNGIKFFDVDDGEVPQWTDCLVERRRELDAYLAALNISCRRFWFPIHTQVPYKAPDADFPHSTKMSARALWLPSAFTMTDGEVDRVSESIKKFYGGRR
jgi:perosamine synthetase